MTDDISHEELESLIEQWRDEVAMHSRRARNWEGKMSDEYRLKGMAMGMDIAVHELQELLDD